MIYSYITLKIIQDIALHKCDASFPFPTLQSRTSECKPTHRLNTWRILNGLHHLIAGPLIMIMACPKSNDHIKMAIVLHLSFLLSMFAAALISFQALASLYHGDGPVIMFLSLAKHSFSMSFLIDMLFILWCNCIYCCSLEIVLLLEFLE